MAFIVSIILGNLLHITPVYAASNPCDATFLGIPSWYNGLCDDEGNVDIDKSDPSESIQIIILNVAGIIMRLCGYAALFVVIWGGFRYLTSAGDANKISYAKKTIQAALIGLLISLSAVAIVSFIKGVLLP
jgi:hypothetical protein